MKPYDIKSATQDSLRILLTHRSDAEDLDNRLLEISSIAKSKIIEMSNVNYIEEINNKSTKDILLGMLFSIPSKKYLTVKELLASQPKEVDIVYFAMLYTLAYRYRKWLLSGKYDISLELFKKEIENL